MNQTLLIIDAQQELIEGNLGASPIYNKVQLIKNINKVIEKAKEAGVPVVFVRDLDVAEGNGNGFHIHNEINVPTKAKVFDKSATNSFYGTGLLEYLKSKHIEHIVIMGCETQHCIDSAVRTATINGFDATLVGDGHSTLGNDVLSKEQIILHHNTTLHGHYNVDNFSIVRKSEEDLFCPTHNSYR
ncbi:cysteine hydrolase family protein [Sutcliffiella rhizosphaerae]|uniref:Peroxyureidoacrylate/ureidoacrylate amidohydrolase RutB n=1 Tax=Sutcliffiella rhizosphaerae TaxID=2880967 RepID=A0ABM8YRS7_9BACI|nr:cysteine hydrolase family protein [Sutcliffiella rhizosphaerae]CAG9622707.1 Peroxyureidoacrylate/ureidoacrylate amidohydrolase RutB [Sutcliffiella rhizosphaerae]